MRTLDILLQGFMNSLCIIALFVSMEDGMILAPVRRFMARRIHYEWFIKPLYGCIICMSSVWGIIFWFTQGKHLSWSLIWVILATAGFNALFSDRISKVVFHYQKARLDGTKD